MTGACVESAPRGARWFPWDTRPITLRDGRVGQAFERFLRRELFPVKHRLDNGLRTHGYEAKLVE